MAYQTGTATDHVDLWDKLIAFLTTDPQLVAENQNWDIAWQPDSNSDDTYENPTDILLRGPGLADSDDIYVAMRRDDSLIASDVCTWYVRGATGVVSSTKAFNGHVNMTPSSVKMFTRPNAMDYWFVASGRRFIVVVQVGTVYESLYAGFFLPYAEPAAYPYPMYIAGSCGSGGPNEATHWNSTRDDHVSIGYPTFDSGATGYNPTAYMLSPSGDWLSVAVNTTSANAHMGPTFVGTGLGLGADLFANGGVNSYGYNDFRLRMGESYGEGFTLTPFTLVQANPGDQTWGVLDGVYHVPGRGQSIENIIQAENSVHVVFQNVFRTSLGAWWAVTLGPEDSNSQWISAEDSNS